MNINDQVKTEQGIGEIVGFRCEKLFVEVHFEKTDTNVIFNRDDIEKV